MELEEWSSLLKSAEENHIISANKVCLSKSFLELVFFFLLQKRKCAESDCGPVGVNVICSSGFLCMGFYIDLSETTLMPTLRLLPQGKYFVFSFVLNQSIRLHPLPDIIC